MYVQQFDKNGRPQNPTSRMLSRRSRRAQNDVLATVGVLSSPDQRIYEPDSPAAADVEGSKFDHRKETAEESEIGLWTVCASQLLAEYAHNRMSCVRQRLQVRLTKAFYPLAN